MRNLLFLHIAMLLIVPLGTEAQDLIAFNQDRLAINVTGMYVLGGWAAGNIAFSG